MNITNITIIDVLFGNFSHMITPTIPPANAGGCGSVHDIGLHKPTRLAILYLTIVSGLIGSVLVALWMTCNRRVTPRFNHLSRVNTFILNLTLADMLVILLAVLPQLIWEYVDREWTAGLVMCKAVKFLQSFSMMSSNYILVAIAIDRHQAIRAPLKEAMSVWQMAGTGWLMATLCSLPMFGVFTLKVNENGIRCENIFRERPDFHRQAWVTYICFAVFFVPLFILFVCYTRIFLKIAQKANENTRATSFRFKTQSGKIHLQSTRSTSLPKAKIKTLKLTFAIIMMFVVCSLPYFIIEMVMSFGSHCIISKATYAFFGGMAACNSAANPFVFLTFNVNISWLKEVRLQMMAAHEKHRDFLLHSVNSSVNSRPSLKYYGKRSGTITTTVHTDIK